MFINEAKIAARLSHPNIVQIFDFGKIDTYYFIAMEYVHGENLRALLQRAAERQLPLSADICAFIVARACAGLEHAHRKSDESGKPLRIIHRDVSPQNVLVSYDGDVKVVDFGIAKAVAENPEATRGVLKGKLAYLSPEQVAGRSLDARSDIFAMDWCSTSCSPARSCSLSPIPQRCSTRSCTSTAPRWRTRFQARSAPARRLAPVAGPRSRATVPVGGRDANGARRIPAHQRRGRHDAAHQPHAAALRRENRRADDASAACPALGQERPGRAGVRTLGIVAALGGRCRWRRARCRRVDPRGAELAGLDGTGRCDRARDQAGASIRAAQRAADRDVAGEQSLADRTLHPRAGDGNGCPERLDDAERASVALAANKPAAAVTAFEKAFAASPELRRMYAPVTPKR